MPNVDKLHKAGLYLNTVSHTSSMKVRRLDQLFYVLLFIFMFYVHVLCSCYMFDAGVHHTA